MLSDTGWVLKFSQPGKVFKDVSFAGNQVGYIVTELGSVYKTTNGGDNWTLVMNLGFPYYWYGVYALTPDTVIISGFNNQASFTDGVIRWTYDGGTTWSGDITLTIPVNGVGWLQNVHFFNADTGIVINSFTGGCWYTLNGGKEVDSWTYVTVNPDLAWFSGNIDAQASGQVYATGIHFAQSTNYGLDWVSGPSADVVFDGGVDFLDDNNLFGWTGGGQISAPVSGWVCRTMDGGQSWSPRLKTFDYPIRAVHFLDESGGWAIGGNLYDEAGGIYSTNDGGVNWTLDVNTFAEMFAIESKAVSADSMDVWCVGSTGGGTGFVGKLYKKRIGYLSTGIEHRDKPDTKNLVLHQNIPNPFSTETMISFTLTVPGYTTLKIYDMLGNEVATLMNDIEQPGYKTLNLDGSRLTSGIYYYRLQTGEFSDTKKLILSK